MDNLFCDVIIPVYNAPDELKECVNSLLIHTSKEHRIIIINDCSPDGNVKLYLDEIKHIDNIIILENMKNLGFVGTVNEGMKFSNRDVVLLNSDTIVTAGWLDKLIEAAYMDTNIATVTPLTNNGTICSVPNFNEDNIVPDGYTIDSFAHFIEKISLRKFPEIPTAVGFCMYIKRHIIGEIGLFDNKTFGKGYGEENDFCCRVIEHGYTNILADNVYIYHKGSMSFQGKKTELISHNLKILNNRYPYYEKKILDFILRNPLKEIYENIKIRMSHYINSHEMKGNILFIIHNFFDEAYNHPVGGTEYHVKDLVENINHYNCYILVTNGVEMVLKHYFKGNLIEKYRFAIDNEITLTHFHHPQYALILEGIISNFDIGLVHIHHLIKHSFDSVHVTKKLGIKVILSLHDFYLFCPRINLLDVNNKYCKDIRSDSKCTNCLSISHGFNTSFIKTWKVKVEELLKEVDLLITPSNSTKQIYKDEFGALVSNNIVTIQHGVDYANNIVPSQFSPPGNVLKVGFLGGLAPAKGSDLIYEVITKYPKKNVEWHLVGGIGDQRLNLLNQKNLYKYGTYMRDELDEIINNLKLDVICLFSPWPETFSYTLSEAWKHNIPVIVTPMGALKERVEKVVGGWVTNDITTNSILDTLNFIRNLDHDAWYKVKENIAAYNHKNKNEMVKQYEEIYNKNLIKVNVSTSLSNKQIIEALSYSMPVDDTAVSDYGNQIYELRKELLSIKSTFGWKVLDRLRRDNKWILKIGKRIIYMLLKFKIAK